MDALALAHASDSIDDYFPGRTTPSRFVLATIHRPENTDTPEALERVLSGLAEIDIPVLFLIHPRTRAAITRHGLDRYLEHLITAPSVGHTELLSLARTATLLISDSGGFQEECTVLGKPLLVIRRSTERPESVTAGFARLITPDLPIAATANAVLNALPTGLDQIPSPYGDTHASTRITEIAVTLADTGAHTV